MARVLRLTPRQRNRLLLVGCLGFGVLFLIFNHLVNRYNALHLDDVYDPPSAYEDVDTTAANATRILIVTALFPLKRAKNGYDIYPTWVRRFLSEVTTDVYFFCNDENAESMRELRRPGLPLVIDTTFKTPFDTPPLKGLEKIYQQMHKIDRERTYHSPELYAVWNAKPYLTDYATKLLASQGKHYDYIFWSDAGSFREDHVYKEWPYGPRVDRVWEEGAQISGVPKEDLLFYPTYNAPPARFVTWKPDDGPLDVQFSEGMYDSINHKLKNTTLPYPPFHFNFSLFSFRRSLYPQFTTLYQKKLLRA